MIKQLTILCFILFFWTSSQSQILLQETTVDTSTIISGLDIPWEIQYGPDDHLWVTERFGRVSRINPETGEQDVVLDLSGTVQQSGESGMLGLVLHPDFENDPYVYLAYTFSSGGIKERIVRFTYNGSDLVDELILLDNIPGNTTHDGCRLIITPDMKLLATTGDAQNQPAAQDINDLRGKVLRLNLDGTIPGDNPWEGNPVFSYGHRNAQGLYLASNGILYSSEHGPANDDELNIIEGSGNYGWPNVHGFCDETWELTFCEDHNVMEPLEAWTPTIATSDIVFYDHPAVPEWEGRILLTSLKNKRLYVMELNQDGTAVIGEDQYFFNLWGRLRDVCLGPEGEIYLATNGPDWGNSQPFTHSIVKVWNPDYIFSSDDQNTVPRSIQLTPNPVRHYIRIKSTELLDNHRLQFFNSMSQKVLDKPLSGSFSEVSVSGLEPGLYFVSITGSNKVVYSGKILVVPE